MPKATETQRTITRHNATDEAPPSFLGPKPDGLSEIVEDSVRWRLFDRTVQTVKDRNTPLDARKVQNEIDDAVREVREEMARERSQGTAY